MSGCQCPGDPMDPWRMHVTGCPGSVLAAAHINRDSQPRLLRISEVAAVLAVSQKTVRRYISRGKLLAANVSAEDDRPQWRVGEDELARFIARATQKNRNS